MTELYRQTLYIEATPDRVFDCFVRPELLVQWMGDHAQLEAVLGGLFSVDINGVLIRGSYVRLDRPTLIEISWGQAGNEAMPPGSSQLIVTLWPDGQGTMLELRHTGLVPVEAKKHAIGWPHFVQRLAVLARDHDPGPDPWATSPPGK